MSDVRLAGRLVCENLDESELVARYLPTHIELTRAEPGCLLFNVLLSEDPFVWTVEERYIDSESFNTHQARVAASEWGRRTAGIARDYTVTGLTD